MAGTRRGLLAGALALASTRFAAAGQLAEGPRRPGPWAQDPFGLGVASGDPRRDGFVLWTRCVGANRDISVGYEVAEDEQFRTIVRRGEVGAARGRGGAVHLDIGGLRSGRPHWYRFHAGEAVSSVGRTFTIPDDPKRLRLALASCQHWEHGYFSAYSDMTEQNVDVVLHVGDYIYEYPYGPGPDVRRFGAADPRDLDGFRARHALYKSDPHLQAAHRSHPFVVTWDDHEVQNDYAGVEGVKDLDPRVFLELRAAAYQAYFEHMPLPPQAFRASGEVRLYRRLPFGRLANLHVLDTRQYRDAHACVSPAARKARAIPPCDAAVAPGRSILGPTQERWLARELGSDRAAWTFVVQQTLVSPLRLDAEGSVWSDFWDAYPAARQRLLEALAPVRNPVLLGGDLHSFWACDVPGPAGGVAATEILTTALAARNGPDAMFEAARRLNSHVKHLDNRSAGYVLFDVSPERVQLEMRAVESLADPGSRSRPVARFDIRDGRRGVLPSG